MKSQGAVDFLRLAVRSVLPLAARRRLARLLPGGRSVRQGLPASAGYEVLDAMSATDQPTNGWLVHAVAERQQAAFDLLLRQMAAGQPRTDFQALALAVQKTGLADPLILEAGCGSGWNQDVLRQLLGQPVRYIGLDYSPAMVGLGRRHHPQTRFVAGDACRLPFGDGTVDVLLSGTVLMHLLGYRSAVREGRRVARQWCIFHTVPVLAHRETTVLRKEAYGEPVVEIIFNEDELQHLFRDSGLVLRNTLESLPYNLHAVLGESTTTRTYVCEVAA